MDKFRWNAYADQPHNVASRRERLKHHLKYGFSYIILVALSFSGLIPVFRLYRKYRKAMYRASLEIEAPFAVSVSPAGERNNEVVQNLKDIGVNKTLVRIPSWERKNLPQYEKFIKLLRSHGFEITLALLQQREDVLDPSRWEGFLEEVFTRFKRMCSYFEIGHAWNRTKWGVWDYREYLKLARPASFLAQKHEVKLVGPAVIDFEFQLYPPVLKKVPFEKVSSLLYVDRQGAPENKQCGWDTARKVALLKAVIDGCSGVEQDCWITEVNWPLKDTGKYSPAAGRPNVSEDEQADFLVRYYVICLASGFVERIYWWQLVAPGYGLIDSRQEIWRRRPSFHAFRTMAELLEGSTFLEKVQDVQPEIFMFQKHGRKFAVCWSHGLSETFIFPEKVIRSGIERGRRYRFLLQR